jgi:nucleotide-binding universal stress UspA family protein
LRARRHSSFLQLSAIDNSREKRPKFESSDDRFHEHRVRQHEKAMDRIHQLLTTANAPANRMVKMAERAGAPKFPLDMEQEYSANLIVMGKRVKSRLRRLFF